MWFEIAIVAVLLLTGQVLFGHFEEQTPRGKKLLKHAFAVALFASISYFFGRFWFWIALVAAFIPPLIIYIWWLPKHGINGWTHRTEGQILRAARMEKMINSRSKSFERSIVYG